jgi:hypothetical protein
MFRIAFMLPTWFWSRTLDMFVYMLWLACRPAEARWAAAVGDEPLEDAALAVTGARVGLA